jgi:hypothetical protein
LIRSLIAATCSLLRSFRYRLAPIHRFSQFRRFAIFIPLFTVCFLLPTTA